MEQARKTRHMNFGSVMVGRGSETEGNRDRVFESGKYENGSSVAVTKTVVDISSGSDDDVEKVPSSRVLESDAAYSVAVDMNDVFRFDEETEKNGDVAFTDNGETVIACSKGDFDEKMEDPEVGFLAGDFVWGKIKSHPWCPGQIYDSKDASAFAIKHSQEDRILVAYFGDGSCSWCMPSQIVPFVENFKQMSADSSSKNLMNAIQSALSDISRLVENNMTCKCVPSGRRDGLAKPMASNAGVKSGVLVPDVDFRRLSIPEYCSNRILEILTDYAKSVSVECLLELSILKSWLSAYYRAKGGRYRLPVYCEPVCINGLEDKNKKSSVQSEILLLGLYEDDCKSASEPIGENNYLERPKSLKRGMEVKEEKGMRKSASSGKRTKSNEDGEKGVDSSKGMEISHLLGESKEMILAVEKSLAESNEELEIISSPRERKKSKYLCPPYTNPEWSTRKLWSENSLTKTEHSVSPSSHSMSSSDKDLAIIQTSESCKKLSFSASDVDLQVDELLSEVRLAAVDRFYLAKKGSLEAVSVSKFLSALRSSTYPSGADYKTYQKSISDANKSLSLSNQEIDDSVSAQDKTKSGNDAEAPKSVLKKTEGKTPYSRKTPKTKVSTGLILTFAPGFPLPSKEEIMGVFGKFGNLNKKKTNVMPESYSVQIVYSKKSNAEVAFKSSVAECPFGAENLKYWIQRSSSNSNSEQHSVKIPALTEEMDSDSKQLSLMIPTLSEETDGFVTDVSIIKQKLEIMAAILENCHSKFSAEEKSSIEDEMKKLTKNVEMVSEMVRVTAEKFS